MSQRTFLNHKAWGICTISCNLDWINFLLPNYLLWIHSHFGQLRQVAKLEVYPSPPYWFYLCSRSSSKVQFSWMSVLTVSVRGEFSVFWTWPCLLHCFYCRAQLHSSTWCLSSLQTVSSKFCQLQLSQGSPIKSLFCVSQVCKNRDYEPRDKSWEHVKSFLQFIMLYFFFEED